MSIVREWSDRPKPLYSVDGNVVWDWMRKIPKPPVKKHIYDVAVQGISKENTRYYGTKMIEKCGESFVSNLKEVFELSLEGLGKVPVDMIGDPIHDNWLPKTTFLQMAHFINSYEPYMNKLYNTNDNDPTGRDTPVGMSNVKRVTTYSEEDFESDDESEGSETNSRSPSPEPESPPESPAIPPRVDAPVPNDSDDESDEGIGEEVLVATVPNNPNRVVGNGGGDVQGAAAAQDEPAGSTAPPSLVPVPPAQARKRRPLNGPTRKVKSKPEDSSLPPIAPVASVTAPTEAEVQNEAPTTTSGKIEPEALNDIAEEIETAAKPTDIPISTNMVTMVAKIEAHPKVAHPIRAEKGSSSITKSVVGISKPNGEISRDFPKLDLEQEIEESMAKEKETEAASSTGSSIKDDESSLSVRGRKVDQRNPDSAKLSKAPKSGDKRKPPLPAQLKAKPKPEPLRPVRQMKNKADTAAATDKERVAKVKSDKVMKGQQKNLGGLKRSESDSTKQKNGPESEDRKSRSVSNRRNATADRKTEVKPKVNLKKLGSAAEVFTPKRQEKPATGRRAQKDKAKGGLNEQPSTKPSSSGTSITPATDIKGSTFKDERPEFIVARNLMRVKAQDAHIITPRPGTPIGIPEASASNTSLGEDSVSLTSEESLPPIPAKLTAVDLIGEKKSETTKDDFVDEGFEAFMASKDDEEDEIDAEPRPKSRFMKHPIRDNKGTKTPESDEESASDTKAKLYTDEQKAEIMTNGDIEEKTEVLVAEMQKADDLSDEIEECRRSNDMATKKLLLCKIQKALVYRASFIDDLFNAFTKHGAFGQKQMHLILNQRLPDQMTKGFVHYTEDQDLQQLEMANYALEEERKMFDAESYWFDMSPEETEKIHNGIVSQAPLDQPAPKSSSESEKKPQTQGQVNAQTDDKPREMGGIFSPVPSEPVPNAPIPSEPAPKDSIRRDPVPSDLVPSEQKQQKLQEQRYMAPSPQPAQRQSGLQLREVPYDEPSRMQGSMTPLPQEHHDPMDDFPRTQLRQQQDLMRGLNDPIGNDTRRRKVLGPIADTQPSKQLQATPPAKPKPARYIGFASRVVPTEPLGVKFRSNIQHQQITKAPGPVKAIHAMPEMHTTRPKDHTPGTGSLLQGRQQKEQNRINPLPPKPDARQFRNGAHARNPMADPRTPGSMADPRTPGPMAGPRTPGPMAGPRTPGPRYRGVGASGPYSTLEPDPRFRDYQGGNHHYGY